MPATSWTELTVAAAGFIKGVPTTGSGQITGFSLFGLPIPIDSGVAFADPTAAWSEMTVSATSYSEMSTPATTWTEVTG